MKNIYTFGGQPARRNLTVADLRAAKGKRVLTEVSAYTAEEGAAASAAGIDIICDRQPTNRRGAQRGARNLHLHRNQLDGISQ